MATGGTGSDIFFPIDTMQVTDLNTRSDGFVRARR